MDFQFCSEFGEIFTEKSKRGGGKEANFGRFAAKEDKFGKKIAQGKDPLAALANALKQGAQMRLLRNTSVTTTPQTSD